MAVFITQVCCTLHSQNVEKPLPPLLFTTFLPVFSTYPCLSIRQVVSASRLVGADHPLEVVYFVEGRGGQRMPADQAADILNNIDVQRAAIILGYRVQGVLAQREYRVYWTKLERVSSYLSGC